jgi:hypothetical protein
MTRRRAFLAAGLAGLGAVAGVGCSNPAAFTYFLFRGDEKVPAEHPLPPKGEKKEVTVAVLTSTGGSLPMDFAGVDRELGALVGKAMAEATKDDKHPVRVVEAAKVDKAKATPGQDWRTANPAEIGKQLGADYVLDLTVTGMGIYSGDYAKEFYSGKADVAVVVYDCGAKDGAPKSQYVHNSKYPTKSTEAMTPAGYRQLFLHRLGNEIAWRHVTHVADRAIARRD